MKNSNDGSSDTRSHTMMKSALKQGALAAGGLAIGYTAYRIYQASHAEFREREEMLDQWLQKRLAELEHAFDLTKDQLAWFEHELAAVTKLANRACRKMEKLAPEVLDQLSLEIEEKFLKMKMNVRKTLKLTDDHHLDALHTFYEEFRQRFFGLHREEESQPLEAELNMASVSGGQIITD